MTEGFEVGTEIAFRASHRMPVEGPEGRLHEHPYRVQIVVGRRRLDERAMVCDLDRLNAVLGGVRAALEGRDLETIRPPDAEAVTVEVLARWVHEAVHDAARDAGGEILSVRVWESAAEFGGYTSALVDREGED